MTFHQIIMTRVLVYYIGIIGVPGKGPHLVESYNPEKTIGDIIKNVKNTVTERAKRVEILKFEKGNINKYDKNNPYWAHDTKLKEYVNHAGGLNGGDVMLIFCLV
jgi:hypothetical protein